MGILDIIAKETGGERQYSDQYAISYKGSQYAHRQQRKPEELKTYKAEYEDGEMEIFSFCESDEQAIKEAESYEAEHGTLWNVFEVDEDYNEIRTVF